MNDDDLFAGFGALINALSGGGDIGNPFPKSDAEDIAKGARFIPGEVTLARRAGTKVSFISECGPCCWYWLMPDNTRIYHWDRLTYEQIACANGHRWDGRFNDEAGPCPICGNPNTTGRTVPPD